MHDSTGGPSQQTRRNVGLVARPLEYDAVVVGSGPNGLTAAIRLAEAGLSVLVVEGSDRPGGGMRTAELTEPGFRHDVCAAAHPLGIASPAFRSMPLADHGLEWLHSPVEAAHPLGGTASGQLLRDIDATDLANGSGGRWARLIRPLVARWPDITEHVLGPVASAATRPVAAARLGLPGLLPATTMAGRILPGTGGAMFSGLAAHANTSLSGPLTSMAGLVFAASAHVDGWPVARGGSGSITDALVSYLRSLGGEVRCGMPVRSIHELPAARAVVFDTTPWQLLDIAGDRLSRWQRSRWRRFRRGAAAFKVDYALDGPVPWTADAPRHAVTVHVGGPASEVAASEHEVASGRVPERPFVLVAQQSLVDPSRAPCGKHTLWAYCHVPNGSTVDMTERIERQIDRFAPGWRDLIISRSSRGPAGMEAHNANYRGGDIGAGAVDGMQMLFRPDASIDPYRTSAPGVWICSASTPPGAGVHGICGDRAARSMLRALAKGDHRLPLR